MSETQGYRIVITGEDGRGDQVFEAKDPEELADKFKSAQTHATRKISEQEGELQRLREENALLADQATAREPKPAPPETGESGGLDRERYLRLLATDPLAANRYLLAFDKAWPEELRQDYKMVRTAASYGLRQQINAEFVKQHPELLQVSKDDDQHNCTAINKLIADNGWAYNAVNLEAAYEYARAKDLLRLPTPESTAAPAPATVPTVITSGAGSPTPNADAEFEKFIRTEPDIEKVRSAIVQRVQTRSTA